MGRNLQGRQLATVQILAGHGQANPFLTVVRNGKDEHVPIKKPNLQKADNVGTLCIIPLLMQHRLLRNSVVASTLLACTAHLWMPTSVGAFRFTATRTFVKAFEKKNSVKNLPSNPHVLPFASVFTNHQQRPQATMVSALPSVTVSATASTTQKEIRAKLVSLDQLEECGERLRQGELVAFPTETVYGLGCNALDPEAIVKIFQAKERPLTDPLITHVTSPDTAFALWTASANSLERKALQSITSKFWPGPLTLVARAAPHVPTILMANSGFAACRAPKHPIAIALIDSAGVPIAAPSANKFGHVSPTRSYHVWDDLKYEDVWILDTGKDSATNDSICEVGVESSVVKIEMITESRGRIAMLRQGAISVSDVKQCLQEDGLLTSFDITADTKRATEDSVINVAPGQTIRHYSPDIPSFILSDSRCQLSDELLREDIDHLSKTVIIDFCGKLKAWKGHAIAYRELCESGDSAEATKTVFETLRWAERVPKAERIIFPQILEGENSDLDALTLALKDRLTRAASGVVIDTLKN